MIIRQVRVEYGELRSSSVGFTNITYRVAYEASVDLGERPEDVRRDLMARAVRDVKALHGDPVDGMKVEISLVPAIEPEEIPF